MFIEKGTVMILIAWICARLAILHKEIRRDTDISRTACTRPMDYTFQFLPAPLSWGLNLLSLAGVSAVIGKTDWQGARA